jgi:UDP-glucuronate 4-epimerase
LLFADAISEGRPIRVFNGGDLARDFTYIDDITEGVVRVVAGVPPTGEVPCKVYNIGCSTPVRLMDFISTMERAFGREAEKVMLPMQAGDVYQTYADTSLLERDYGYRPTTTLEEGLRRFVEWYGTENPLRR